MPRRHPPEKKRYNVPKGAPAFDCAGSHSEFQALRQVRHLARPMEVSRHEPLTDRMGLHYYELPKLPDALEPGDGVHLWLRLFKAETEEDLKQIKELGVAVMEQAIEAYRSVTAASEFRELEMPRSLARHNEASALRHARGRAGPRGSKDSPRRYGMTASHLRQTPIRVSCKAHRFFAIGQLSH